MTFERDHFLAKEKRRVARERAQSLKEYADSVATPIAVRVVYDEKNPYRIRPDITPPKPSVPVRVEPQIQREAAAISLPATTTLHRTTKENRATTYALAFLAYALPVLFLAYVLYWNYLPFGYDKTFTIKVGSPSDTSGEFRLLPSKFLSEPKTAPDGSTYRELRGLAFATFEPAVALSNAKISIAIDGGPGTEVIPTNISITPSASQWDYDWDFSTSTPSTLTGTAFNFDNATCFDGQSQLELQESANIFESGTFSVYIEWNPEDTSSDFQQLIGHYNWELLQNQTSVTFQIGRTDNADGPFYSISHKVDSEFFNKKHTALAIYAPNDRNGYIRLYVDGVFRGQTDIGSSKIWPEYNGNRNLTLGKSAHGIGSPFRGCIQHASLRYGHALIANQKASFISSDRTIRIPINASATTSLQNIRIYVQQ